MNDAKKMQARGLYIQQHKTKTEIAAMIGVDRKTLYNWIMEGHWQELRIIGRQSPVHILQSTYNHIDALNMRIASRAGALPYETETAMLCKLMAAARNYGYRYAGFYMQAYEELIASIAPDNNELSASVQEYVDKIIMAMSVDAKFELNEKDPEVPIKVLKQKKFTEEQCQAMMARETTEKGRKSLDRFLYDTVLPECLVLKKVYT